MPHPYTTFAAVEDELPWLKDSWGQQNLPTVAQIEARLEENDQLIDAKLAPKFAVPLDTVPELVAAISRDLTVAWIRGRQINLDTGDVDPFAKTIRDEAMARLKALADAGKDALEALGVPQADTTAGAARRPLGSDDGSVEPTFKKAEVQW